MKVIVAGGRNFIATPEDYTWLIDKLEELGTTEVVCGMAKGADLFGKEVAESIGIPVTEFPAEWTKYGKKAGWKRNVKMVMYGDIVILFPGGIGTQQMKEIAKNNKLVIVERNIA